MVSQTRRCCSVNVRLHLGQRKRRRPLRCFPKRWHSTEQPSQVIAGAVCVSLIMVREYSKRSLFVKPENVLGFGVRTVGLEPTSPVRSGGFKDRCVYRSTTSARCGEHPKMLPVAFYGMLQPTGGPRIWGTAFLLPVPNVAHLWWRSHRNLN